MRIIRINYKPWKLAIPILFLIISPLFSQAEPIRILALGNSITQADQNNFSYRYYLWKKLIDANIEFDFVGSLDMNKGGNPAWPTYQGRTFDRDHEGHHGWTVDQLLDGHQHEPNAGRLAQWLQGYTPDIVLLHAGTNDAILGQSLDGTINELKEVVRLIRQKNPAVTILMAKLIPAFGDKVGKDNAENIPKLNDKIAILATQLNTDLSKVTLVDQFTDFDPTPGADSFDGLHPNASGEEKMAQRWFDALNPLLKPLGIGNELDALHQLQLYPTLVHNQPLYVKAEKLKPGSPVKIYIYSVDGKLAMQLETTVDNRGNLATEINLQQKLSAGMYITSIHTPEYTFFRKFIVTR
jgi:lysophospholipase L1-like esterase